MAMKFLTLEEAAQKLGISEDALNQLRERHEAHGYRDGSSWKFKVEEIERLASEGLPEMTDSSDSGELMDFDMDEDDGDDMVLLSEAELGESDPSTSSTIIGKPGSVQDPGESDVRVLAGEESGSDVKLVPDADASASDSGVKLAPAVPETPPETPKEPDVGESGLSLDDDSLELDLDFGSGVPLVSEDSPTDQVDDVNLEVEDDAVSLSDEYGISEDSDEDDSGGDINLGGESDDDFVLRGGGSDITMGAGDSGISLADPADSGLSLADPLDLGSSSGGEMLDLGEDDGSSDFELSSDSDSEAISEVGSDDDFLLTPMDEAGDADSEESGSQVIALDESDDFGASAAAMLDEAGGDMVSMVEDGEESVDFSESTSTSSYAGAAAMQPRGPEARFSTWDVVGLGACSILLVMCGMVMFDLMRNMWSWQGTYAANGMIMDFVLGLFE